MKLTLINSIFIILFIKNISTYSQSKNDIYTLNQLIGKETSTLHNPINKLNINTYNAFLKMKEEALKEGIDIQIVSGYRSFKRQQQIFSKKYLRYKKLGLLETVILNKIIEYSTIPGTSRHHWGTDIDIIQRVKTMPKNLLVTKNYEAMGAFCKMKEWMDQNAYRFGFYLVYTNQANRSGFKYEPWHYSYAPISKKLLKQFLTLEKNNLIYEEIQKSKINIDSFYYKKYINTHIKGVNPLLLIP